MAKVYATSGYIPVLSEVIQMIPNKELVATAYLRQDGRMKLAELRRKTGVPVSTLYDWVKKRKCLGVSRFTALLDFPSIGFATQATILLKAGKNGRKRLQEFLLHSAPVNSLMRINNGYDYLAECVFKDLFCLEEFCEQLEFEYSVKTKEIHLTVDELKREGFLADPLAIARRAKNE